MSEVLYQGDSIITPYKPFLGLSHYAIFAGTCSNGINWAIHNVPNAGVCWIKLEDLLYKGYEKIERMGGDMESRYHTLKSAVAKIGKEYNIFTYNCEHFANEVQTGKAKSYQVRNFLFSCVVILIIYKLLKSK